MRTSGILSAGAAGLVFRIFSVPFILAGVAALCLRTWHIYGATSSSSWPTTTGTVRESAVEYQSGSRGGGTYAARVRYEYVLDGVTHSGNRVTWTEISTSDSVRAQGIVNRYPVNRAIEVRTIPRTPMRACWSRGSTRRSAFCRRSASCS